MNLFDLKCKNCGAALHVENARDGVVECEYCFTVRTLPKETENNGVPEYLRMGEHDLDTGKFEEARAAFQKASEADRSEPEAYWGMALADFKVQYIKDSVNNKLQAICHEAGRDLFRDNRNYVKALAYATPSQRAEYEKRAEEIDYIRGEFYKLKSAGVDYDCFLCVKVSDPNGGKTEDYKDADLIYELLQDKGYMPFYSERCIRNRTGADYEAMILYALYSCETMLVVCRDPGYLQTPWVKNEYTRFLKLVNDEEKESDAITVVYYGRPIDRLPGKNGKIQGIDFSQPQAAVRIIDFVEGHTPRAKERRQREKEEKLRQEEELKRKLEELEEKNRREREELKRQLASVTNTAGPATESVNSLLMRASQELAADSLEKAGTYYNRVLDIKPDCAEAWFGLSLIDYGSTSDSELIAKINKETGRKSPVESSLFYAICANRNFTTAKSYASGETMERLEAIERVCEEKKAALCGIVSPDLNPFYNAVLSRDGKKPYATDAAYDLVLTRYLCPSGEALIQKLRAATPAHGYEILFELPALQTVTVLAAEKDGKYQKECSLFIQECFSKKRELTAWVTPEGKEFYGRILKENGNAVYAPYARYALFLIGHDRTSAEELVNKIRNCSIYEEGVDTLERIYETLGETATLCSSNEEITENLVWVRSVLDERLTVIRRELEAERATRIEKERECERRVEVYAEGGKVKVKDVSRRRIPFKLVFYLFFALGVAGGITLYGVKFSETKGLYFSELISMGFAHSGNPIAYVLDFFICFMAGDIIGAVLGGVMYLILVIISAISYGVRASKNHSRAELKRNYNSACGSLNAARGRVKQVDNLLGRLDTIGRKYVR